MNFNSIKVQNMLSNSGREVPNQFEVYTDNGKYFQSYSSVIAYRPYDGGKILLDQDKWDYSVTTGKYRNQFLGESIKETRAKIADGTYILADLNKE